MARKPVNVLGGKKPPTEAEVKKIAPGLLGLSVCTDEHDGKPVMVFSGSDVKRRYHVIYCRSLEEAITVRTWLREGEYGRDVRDDGGLLPPEEFPPHPAASLFPLMNDAELAELAADIKANGQREPVIIYQGQVLDGRNRIAACKLAGVEPRARMVNDYTIKGLPIAFVISCNLHRRHLTAEQKRQVIAAALKADPTRSNRQVAEKVGVHHATVASVREEEERRGQIIHVETTTDTKGRRQPAKKKTTQRAAAIAAEHAKESEVAEVPQADDQPNDDGEEQEAAAAQAPPLDEGGTPIPPKALAAFNDGAVEPAAHQNLAAPSTTGLSLRPGRIRYTRPSGPDDRLDEEGGPDLGLLSVADLMAWVWQTHLVYERLRPEYDVLNLEAIRAGNVGDKKQERRLKKQVRDLNRRMGTVLGDRARALDCLQDRAKEEVEREGHQ
jgi:ParB-like chromosome segregation protein Spo0J